MSLDSSILKVNCYCGKKTELNREEQEKIFGSKVLIADISSFYENLICSNCKKKYPEIIDNNGNIIFDTSSTTRCVNCDCLISKPRQETFPGSNICGKKCSEDISETFHRLREQLSITAYESSEYLNYSDYQKPPSVDLTNPTIRQTTLNLSARRSEMLKLIYKLKNGEISKTEYEVNFKRFTWWIKENLEKIGGGIHDDPRNYLKCEKCNEPSLINWTNKYNCYFISCSTFSETKCDWIKNPWFYPNK